MHRSVLCSTSIQRPKRTVNAMGLRAIIEYSIVDFVFSRILSYHNIPAQVMIAFKWRLSQIASEIHWSNYHILIICSPQTKHKLLPSKTLPFWNYKTTQPWSTQTTTTNHSSVCSRLCLKTTKSDTRLPTWTTDFSSSILPERAKPLNQFHFPVHPMKPSQPNLSSSMPTTINQLRCHLFSTTTTQVDHPHQLWTIPMWFVDETNQPSITLVIDVSGWPFPSFWNDIWKTHVAWIVRVWSMRSSTLFKNLEVDSWGNLLTESGSSWVRRSNGTRLDMHCEMRPPPIVATTNEVGVR